MDCIHGKGSDSDSTIICLGVEKSDSILLSVRIKNLIYWTFNMKW